MEVLAVGLTYKDFVFTVDALPRPGEERHAKDLIEMWGGIATMARVCAQLGLDTGLATAVGADDESRHLLADMAKAGIDTSLTRAHAGWRLPITVALSLPHDRAMVTLEDPLPVGVAAHLAEVEIDAKSIIVDLRDQAEPWLLRARDGGALVFASRGFDPSERWDEQALAGLAGTDVWMLNDLEAKAFTGLDDPQQAARKLAERVGQVVVTLGADGMVAVDAGTNTEAKAAAFPVVPKSTTGAGDTTLAAFAFAHTIEATLEQRLMLAGFITSTVLGSPGGAATPPRREELIAKARQGGDPRLVQIERLLTTRS